MFGSHRRKPNGRVGRAEKLDAALSYEVSQHRFHFRCREHRSNAAMGAAAEGQIFVRCGLALVRPATGIEPGGLWPELRQPMGHVRADDDRGAGRDVVAFEIEGADGFAQVDRPRWIKPESLTDHVVQIGQLRQVVGGQVAAGRHGGGGDFGSRAARKSPGRPARLGWPRPSRRWWFRSQRR